MIKGTPTILMLFLLALAAPGYASAERSTSQTYSVGIVPQFDIRKIHTIWRPILETLEAHTGLELRLESKPTIPEFELALANGEFDFAYMNPYIAITIGQSQGYIPLARDHGASLYGILVVKKDNPIQDLKKLEGQTIAFPAPNAMGATLIIKADMEDLHGIQVKPEYVLTHSSVYFNVALGRVVAGGGVQKTFQEQPPAVQEKLRILYRTRSFSPHPFSAHPRVPEAIRQQVLDSLLAMGATPSGQELLELVPVRRIGPATIADYQPLLNMNLERYYTAPR